MGIYQADFKKIQEDINSLDTDIVVLITEHVVWEKYSEVLPFKLSDSKKVILWKTPAGEKTKSIDEYARCTEFILEKGIHRKAHLVAWGGGALSDFAGFVAATLLRGISWSVIPTTLLSMVDAAVGGKTAINSLRTKNLIGAFHSPENIWIHPDFLKTLSVREMNSGKGEIAKYCFLAKNIYSLVTSNANLEDIIWACAQHKLNVTSKDFKETGDRKALNLGHTFGHALENIYDLPHGLAVFWGMALIFKLFGEQQNLDCLREVRRCLQLPEESPPWLNKSFPLKKIMALIEKDKKREPGGVVTLVNVSSIGNVFVKEYSLERLEEILKDNKDVLKTFAL